MSKPTLAPKRRKKLRGRSHADIVLESMRPLVHMVATSVGPNCEVVLHDLRTPNSSVIEIAGNLSERHVGAPVNEISRWLLAQGKDVEEKTNKLIRTARGRTLKSSAMLLRGRDGKAFGVFCINIDVTEFISVSRIMADMACSEEVAPRPPKLGDDIAYVVQTVIAAEETKTGIRLNIGVREDRLRLLRALQAHGVFTLKRAVPRLAEHFGVSRATIYSYLNETNGAAAGGT
jgi:predicted transcriptional regulator YheO